ncbi:MAG TPA: vWA domain-containing protein [Xanthomonadales bacterium]|nr:vWA domain-containing protein [Xanthomonadales bacterium]
MRTKLFIMTLFTASLGAVLFYPHVQAKNIVVDPQPVQHLISKQQPKIDVVFALDTTGSMSGLIEAAKQNIWSIASTMASAQPTPEIRIGLVAYRDRGDEYVTRVVDLSSDLDSVYATLMDFQAGGGGDTPESVNQALNDAVHKMSWSEGDQAYRVIFLVGDAPPHMDYNETQYPEIVQAARTRGIVVNTIQCGDMGVTVDPWNAIASLGNGDFLHVSQAGNAVAVNTPFDDELARLAKQLDDTRLYYGNDEEKSRMKAKTDATAKLNQGASVESRARRAVFNSSAGGRKNLLGENELVDAVASGDVALEELDEAALPESLKAMAPEEQAQHIAVLAGQREDIQKKIQILAKDRDAFIAEKEEEAGGFEDSLDAQLYDVVARQAAEVGLEYEEGPEY